MQEKLKVKIKKLHENAVIPKYAKSGDAGMDLTAISKSYDEYGNISYGTGLAFEIPKGYVGLLFPRSSNCKQDLILSNSVGVIDSEYRGEILLKFKPSSIVYGEDDEELEWDKNTMSIDVPESTNFIHYNIGDRVGQLIIIPYPQIKFEEVKELSETERGEKGYGSTGL